MREGGAHVRGMSAQDLGGGAKVTRRSRRWRYLGRKLLDLSLRWGSAYCSHSLCQSLYQSLCPLGEQGMSVSLPNRQHGSQCVKMNEWAKVKRLRVVK